MRVLYIVSTLERTGPINQLYNIIKYLEWGSVEPVILTLSPEPSSSRRTEFEALDIHVESIRGPRGILLPRMVATVRETVDALDPDVIHTQGVRPDVLSAFGLSNYNRVATLRNYPIYDYTNAFGNLRGRLLAALHLRVLGRIDRPVACSESVRKLAGGHGIDFDVVRNGVDTDVYMPPSEDERSSCRAELGLSRPDPLVISVGALSTRKDPETVIEGFLMSDGGEGGQLLLVGSGDRRAACETLANGGSNVRFEGHVDNVVPYLQAADYFVSASTAEGLPNTVMEAMACGLPVCLSDIGPHEEILGLENGPAGVSFETGNSVKLAEALTELVDRDRAPLSSNARSLVETNLSARLTAERYQEIYRDLMV